MNSIELTFEQKTADVLIWNGQVVMSRTEEPYFEAIFSRLGYLKPDSVLEIGFGLGISAGLIQKYMAPKLHDIYEIEKSIYADLEHFADAHPSVRPFLGDWNGYINDQRYDFIFYDPFDYFSEIENASCETYEAARAETASRLKVLLKKDGILCHPHFGDGNVPDLPGFTTTIIDRLKVTPIRMADETLCEDVAIVLREHMTEL